MSSSRRLLTLLVVVTLILAACGGDDEAAETTTTSATPSTTNPEEPEVDITGRTWTVTGIIVTDIVEQPPAGATVTLEIEGDTIAGEAGCNRYSGSVSIDGTSLRVGSEIVLTMMACPDTTDWMEFLDLLDQATSFEAVGDSVVINTLSGGSIILE